jgi:hypothetical protein
LSYGLDPLNASGVDGGTNDPDFDGADTWAEYIADTHPLDSNSYLAIIGITASNEEALVEWKGGQMATQYLEIKEDPTSTTEQWTAIYTNIPITMITNAFVDPGATNINLQYRIKAVR